MCPISETFNNSAGAPDCTVRCTVFLNDQRRYRILWSTCENDENCIHTSFATQKGTYWCFYHPTTTFAIFITEKIQDSSPLSIYKEDLFLSTTSSKDIKILNTTLKKNSLGSVCVVHWCCYKHGFHAFPDMLIPTFTCLFSQFHCANVDWLLIWLKKFPNICNSNPEIHLQILKCGQQDHFLQRQAQQLLCHWHSTWLYVLYLSTLVASGIHGKFY